MHKKLKAVIHYSVYREAVAEAYYRKKYEGGKENEDYYIWLLNQDEEKWEELVKAMDKD
ncbi:hypothetical protein [Geminocystis sp. NIES-3709]|uniref:hypothetical protein n=1 Tax=Geminocystis sp. NIES-3709 TaxID=1617448 RepID=UPI0005FC9E77|nr:hypothetical protein [Geminocystis sp. NIES-3709]BAQ67094.1 hypothetical protein GM3709_3859 [Geminocystis sp. NIES-3709]